MCSHRVYRCVSPPLPTPVEQYLRPEITPCSLCVLFKEYSVCCAMSLITALSLKESQSSGFFFVFFLFFLAWTSLLLLSSSIFFILLYLNFCYVPTTTSPVNIFRSALPLSKCHIFSDTQRDTCILCAKHNQIHLIISVFCKFLTYQVLGDD